MATSKSNGLHTPNRTEPIGFCPRCNYPMDPGRCPECGTDVPPVRLVRCIDKARRRRRVRRALYGTGVLMIVASGYTAYRYVNWIPLLPAPVLFALQNHETDMPTAELCRRLRAGELTYAQEQRLFDFMMRVDTNLLFTSPFPANNRVPIRVEILRRILAWGTGPRTWHIVSLENWELAIDDNVIASPASPGTVWITGGDNIVRAEGGALIAGLHQVSFSGDLVLAYDGLGVQRRRLSLTKTLVVDHRPVSAYIDPIWSEDAARDIRDNIRVMAYRMTDATNVVFLGVRAPDLRVPLSGRLEARPSGCSRPFRAVGGEPLYLTAGHDRLRIGMWIPCPDDIVSCDIRFVPNPIYALAAQVDDYFAGIVVWHGVAIQGPLQNMAFKEITAGPSEVLPCLPD